MPRTVSTAISVEDLEYAVEHLIRLAYSPVRAGTVENTHSITIDRERVLEIALEVEKLIGLAVVGDTGQNFTKRTDKCCSSLESVIKKTLNRDGLKKMRVSIRQKRHNSPPCRIAAAYNLLKENDAQKALNL